MNQYAVHFRWVVILGVLLNWFFDLPGIFVPNTVLDWGGIAPIQTPVWLAFGCMMSALVGLFCIVGAIDPFRYAPIAILAVLARLASASFFLFLWTEHRLFGWIDLSFGVVQAILLWLALRRGPTANA